MISKSKVLDQFYTNNETAILCHSRLKAYLKEINIESSDFVWLEPSAGTGSFYNLMPDHKIGVDIDPKIENIIESDFLKFDLPINNYITLGNPPFGKNSSLAIKFFNKCAIYSEIIAFIVPKTFKKDSLKNKLNQKMHLIKEWDIDDFSFSLDDKDVNVPCVFQIWKKEDVLREKIKPLKEMPGFMFCDKEIADLAFQRVGANAGRIKYKDRFASISPSSHIFIKLTDLNDIMILENINWNEIKYNTAGNPSISKSELIKKFQEEKNKFEKNII